MTLGAAHSLPTTKSTSSKVLRCRVGRCFPESRATTVGPVAGMTASLPVSAGPHQMHLSYRVQITAAASILTIIHAGRPAMDRFEQHK